MAQEPKISDMAKPVNGGKEAYPNSIAALRVLIAPEVTTKEIPKRDTGEMMTFYVQRALLIGGPKMEAFEVSTRDINGTRPKGVYLIASSALKTGKYGDLELDRYNVDYIRIGDLSAEQEKLLLPQQTSATDFV